MDMKLEVVVIPVADADRARACCPGLGWRLDADFATGPVFRHGKYEEETGQPDPDWPDWYARYIVDESGRQADGA
jgi:hypothetical protein